jgi:hypothetical protein
MLRYRFPDWGDRDQAGAVGVVTVPPPGQPIAPGDPGDQQAGGERHPPGDVVRAAGQGSAWPE